MNKKVTVFLSIITAVLVIVIAGLGFACYSKTVEMDKELGELQENIDYLQDEHYGSKAYGRLKVEGDKLCGEDGEPVQLKGMSTHGISWYPKYTNAGALSTIKDYGANVIRIAVYSETYMNPDNNAEEYMNYVFNTIENALSINMYVIVDWHILKEENPNYTVDAAVDFFEKIAMHYGNHPYILYEICNEPNGDTTWEDVYEYSARVIPVIRGYASDAIIIVGTPNYCQDVESAAAKPLPYDNIMYAFHMYFDVSDKPENSGTADYCLGKTELGIPVFITEWGLKYDSEEIYSEEVDYFIKELQKRRISWCNWSLSNKDESYSLIDSECNKLSGWSDEDLTPGGRLIKKYLQY